MCPCAFGRGGGSGGLGSKYPLLFKAGGGDTEARALIKLGFGGT